MVKVGIARIMVVTQNIVGVVTVNMNSPRLRTAITNNR